MSARVVRGKQGPDVLHLSFDRKVSPTATYQASRGRWVPTVPNSFGLPSGDTCPGLTSFCASCYAARNEQSAGVRSAVEHNLRLLRWTSIACKATLIHEMLCRYEAHADAAAIPADQRMFRIHWDGDFYSDGYAHAWHAAILLHPDVAFWTYTRSFRPWCNVVPILADLPNLALYLSIDADNAADAAAVLADHPTVRAAGCAEDYQRARALLPPRDQPAIICPENVGRIGLTNEYGRGACVTCRVCPDDRRDILFSTSHREDASVPVRITPRRQPPAVLPPAEVVCGNPACGATFTQERRRGRPRVYCDSDCRYEAYNIARKATA